MQSVTQVVILAAGRGTRMGALTENLPKPMLTVSGKTLLEHKFDVLPAPVTDIIIIVGYQQQVIRDAYAQGYRGRRVVCVEQKNPVGGTMDALLQARALLTGRFLVMMGDDIYSDADVRAVAEHEWSLLVERVADTSVGGRIVTEGNAITDIVEGGTGEGYVSTNLFVLDTRVFGQAPVPKSAHSTELGLPQTVLAASKRFSIPLSLVEATRWIQITAPEDLARAEKILS